MKGDTARTELHRWKASRGQMASSIGVEQEVIAAEDAETAAKKCRFETDKAAHWIRCDLLFHDYGSMAAGVKRSLHCCFVHDAKVGNLTQSFGYGIQII